MTIKVKPLHTCDRPGCSLAAEHIVTFTTHRGQLDGPKVCGKHIGWGKQRAKEIEDS